MQVKPLKNKVLIKPKGESEKTKGGIYIPDSAKEKTQEGKVIAVGDGDEVSVKPGDTVVYESYSGTEIKVSGEKYLIVKGKDILAIIE